MRQDISRGDESSEDSDVEAASDVPGSPDIRLDSMGKKVSWWKRLLMHMKIVRGYDKDFGEDMKIGVKSKWKW